MPIQRVPRYLLLFRNLVKSTPKDFWDYQLLSGVLTKFENTSKNINAARAQAEREARLVKLQEKIKECPFQIFCPKRRLISENLIIEHSNDRHLVTCSDRVIVCDVDWSYRRHINANEISDYQPDLKQNTLTIVVDDSKYEFKMNDPEDAFSELCLPLKSLQKEFQQSKTERQSTVELVERDIQEIQKRSSLSWRQLLDQRSIALTEMNIESEYFGHNPVETSPSHLVTPRRLIISKSISTQSVEGKLMKKRTESMSSLPDSCFFNDDGSELSDSGEFVERSDAVIVSGAISLPNSLHSAGRSKKRKKKKRSLIDLKRSQKGKHRYRKHSSGLEAENRSKKYKRSISSQHMDAAMLSSVTPRNMIPNISKSDESDNIHFIYSCQSMEFDSPEDFTKTNVRSAMLDDYAYKPSHRRTPSNSKELSVSIQEEPQRIMYKYEDYDEPEALTPELQYNYHLAPSPLLPTSGKRPHSRKSIKKDPSFQPSNAAGKTLIEHSKPSQKEHVKSSHKSSHKEHSRATRKERVKAPRKAYINIKPSQKNRRKRDKTPVRVIAEPAVDSILPEQFSDSLETRQIHSRESIKRDPSFDFNFNSSSARGEKRDPGVTLSTSNIDDPVTPPLQNRNSNRSTRSVSKQSESWSHHRYAPEPESSVPSPKRTPERFAVFSRGRERFEKLELEGNSTGMTRSNSAMSSSENEKRYLKMKRRQTKAVSVSPDRFLEGGISFEVPLEVPTSIKSV